MSAPRTDFQLRQVERRLTAAMAKYDGPPGEKANGRLYARLDHERARVVRRISVLKARQRIVRMAP